MSGVRGFLFFDLDGTIAESGGDISKAMNEVFAELGVAPTTDTEKAFLIGPPLQDAIPPLLRARDVDVARTQSVIDRYRQIYKSKYLPHTRAIEGMTEVVRQLHVEQFVLSVVTTKPQPQAGIALRATGLMDCFTTVVGSRENEPTPKDELLRIAMADVSVRLQTTVEVDVSWMIGDRHFDINAAHAVGATSVAVMWGHGDEDEFMSASAHHIVHSPHELLRVIA
jgi:phosphoglycolate phosphatase